MSKTTKIDKDSPALLKVLRALTPLKESINYGPWSKHTWARHLADFMGQRATEFGDACQPWDEFTLQRELDASGSPLPDDLHISDALDQVARGLAAYYWKWLSSTTKDNQRRLRVEAGLSANPKRDITGKRFTDQLPEAWMKTIAIQIVYAAEPSSSTEKFNHDNFQRALDNEGLRLPEGIDIADAILDVYERMQRADPRWFTINIEDPLHQRLSIQLVKPTDPALLRFKGPQPSRIAPD